MAGKKTWTEKQENILRYAYPKHGVDYCMKVLKKTRSSVISKAYEMGLRREERNEEKAEGTSLSL